MIFLLLGCGGGNDPPPNDAEYDPYFEPCGTEDECPGSYVCTPMAEGGNVCLVPCDGPGDCRGRFGIPECTTIELRDGGTGTFCIWSGSSASGREVLRTH